MARRAYRGPWSIATGFALWLLASPVEGALTLYDDFSDVLLSSARWGAQQETLTGSLDHAMFTTRLFYGAAPENSQLLIARRFDSIPTVFGALDEERIQLFTRAVNPMVKAIRADVTMALCFASGAGVVRAQIGLADSSFRATFHVGCTETGGALEIGFLIEKCGPPTGLCTKYAGSGFGPTAVLGGTTTLTLERKGNSLFFTVGNSTFDHVLPPGSSPGPNPAFIGTHIKATVVPTISLIGVFFDNVYLDVAP